MINCDYENFGGRGGHLIDAFNFLITWGTVPNECKPYKNKQQSCEFTCEAGTYSKHYCKPGSLRLESDVSGIYKDIYENGPVVMNLLVYEDLYSYREGIYEYTAGGLVS